MPYPSFLYQSEDRLFRPELPLGDSPLRSTLKLLGSMFGLDPAQIIIQADKETFHSYKGFFSVRSRFDPNQHSRRIYVFGAPKDVDLWRQQFVAGIQNLVSSGQITPDVGSSLIGAHEPFFAKEPAPRIMFSAAHELAHAMLQTQHISRTMELLQDPASQPFSRVVDLAEDIGWRWKIEKELQSDLFAAAVSGPSAWVQYRMAVAAHTDERYLGAKRVTPIDANSFEYRFKVIDPSIVDDPFSRVRQAYRGAVAAFLEESLGWTASHHGWDASSEIPSFIDTQRLRNLAALHASDLLPLSISYAFGQPQDFSKLYTDRSQAELLVDVVQDMTYIGSTVYRKVMSPSVLSAPNKISPFNEDERWFILHSGSRAWTVPYVIAKSRPDLIGQELIYRGGRIYTQSGEEVPIQLPELPDVSDPNIPPPQQIQQVGSAMRDYYERVRKMPYTKVRRALESLQAGPNYLDEWRQWFKQVMGQP